MADIVPFGKYKNQPVEALAQDKSYCAWLSGQSWVAQRFPEIHTLIINNFAEPSETPEHNALQLCFLEKDLQLKVSMCLALYHRPMSYRFKKECYAPFMSTCTEPTFEQKAIDVQWFVGMWYPEYDAHMHYRIDGTMVGENTFNWYRESCHVAIECKPSLGDDYPAVLRFMHTLPHTLKAVVVETYAFRGGTVAQVHKLFQASGVLLLDMPSLGALPAVTCVEENDLPPAEDFSNAKRRYYA